MICGHSTRGVVYQTYFKIIFFLAFFSSFMTDVVQADYSSVDLNSWLTQEADQSLAGIFRNISPPGTAPGVVVASPSKSNPDYYYYWVRDAAITMDVIVRLFEQATATQERETLAQLISNFIDFSRQNQVTPNRSNGLGEPKFNVDGTAYNEDWGRPQNDGPALRSITLIRFARALLACHCQVFQGKDLLKKLYDGKLPSESVIKADLEFISHHWQEGSFDLWEETHGQHFYTRMVQRRALLEGADLANQLGDPGAAQWYRTQAKLLEVEIAKHWSPEKGYLVATLDQDGGSTQKVSGLDVAVVLGSLHGSLQDGFFTPSSDAILITAQRLREAFQNLYPINKNSPQLMPAIGRYPEDIYDGYYVGSSDGNPWVLAVNAYAELYYRISEEWVQRGRVDLTETNLPMIKSLNSGLVLQAGQSIYRGTPAFDLMISKIREEADGFLNRLRVHTPSDGSMAEQINRNTGYMQGAPNLTWSYSSFITALWERNKANTIRAHWEARHTINRWTNSANPSPLALDVSQVGWNFI